MKQMFDSYYRCHLCPNRCNVNRTENEVGICGQTDKVKIAWTGLHKGEEPPISGDNGSGMIFFTGCPLHCQYCQNYQISKENLGYEISGNKLSLIMLELQNKGAETVNLVTGTHFIPTITESLILSKKTGLKIPVVWNSSGYEDVESLSFIDPYIDIYLLDAKTLSVVTASKFCGTSAYVDVIPGVLDYLYKNRREGDVIIRHLVFPGEIGSTADFLHYFADRYKDKFLLSLMFQFVNPYGGKSGKVSDKISEKDYEYLADLTDRLEIDGFIQECGDESYWVPDFNRKNPFPDEFATPVYI